MLFVDTQGCCTEFFFFKDLRFNQKYLPSLFAASTVNLQVLFIMTYRKSSQKEYTTAFPSLLENFELTVVLCILRVAKQGLHQNPTNLSCSLGL